ncbi:nuclear transport factor 2 family protein [Flavihumibacter sp. R14]|nr:nuclear transport factor 2 family protein [Flavihumibacter soli]
MKRILIFLLVCFGMNQLSATPVRETNEEGLAKLMDSLSVAFVKQDKAWLSANLTEDCSLSDPSGMTLAKADIVKAFSPEGVYTLTKMKLVNMKYVVNKDDASGSGSMEIEGAMSAQEVVDVTGTYTIQTGFKKTDSGWKISSIKVSQ